MHMEAATLTDLTEHRLCYSRAGQMKRMVVHGRTSGGDYYLIAEVKKSQHVPFQGRHDCCLTIVCTSETQRNVRERAGGRQSLHSHLIQYINLLATDFFFQILAHPIFKIAASVV